MQWPRGTKAERLAVIDDKLTACTVVLNEAKAHDNLALVADMESRIAELIDDRLDAMHQESP